MLNYNKINSWPFQEAKLILGRIQYLLPSKGYVLFETGYGPSGLPHIGTFGEIARIIMVIKAFKYLSNISVRLFCISDDLDAFKDAPNNIPNKKLYNQYTGLSLINLPDPFLECISYGDCMNVKLIKLLDDFNFKYEFISAANCYKLGKFNNYLIRILERYSNINHVMKLTIGKTRRKTYSSFLPICKNTNKVLQVKIINQNIKSCNISYSNYENNIKIIDVLNGNCKLQWKPDFAMRWAAFKVDYEIYGKDIQANNLLYNKICKILNKLPPNQMSYELFLDINGQKISKSKGLGLSVCDWLKYGNKNSLMFFIYQSPKKAKKLCYNIIPQIFDDYLLYLQRFNNETCLNKKLSNPVFLINKKYTYIVNFCKINYLFLLNLINIYNVSNIQITWICINNMEETVNYDSNELVTLMIICAINYFQNFIKFKKKYKILLQNDIKLLKYFLEAIKMTVNNSKMIENSLYQISSKYKIPLKIWFRLFYETFLGTKKGPRVGTFIKIYGLLKIQSLIKNKIISLKKAY